MMKIWRTYRSTAPFSKSSWGIHAAACGSCWTSHPRVVDSSSMIHVLVLAMALLWAPHVAAQVPPELARERADFAAWLATGATSPFAAVALQRIGTGITIGPPGSDIPLPGVGALGVASSGNRITLDSGGVSRPLPRNRTVPVGNYRLMATGPRERATLLVFGPPHDARAPEYFPYARAAVDTVTLTPAAQRQSALFLGPDGIEVDADDAGTVTATLNGAPVSLRVRRFPGASDDEAEFEIYFRDGTSGQGSYPAGRFVSLDPVGGGRYRLDFNRARNPFCAYSSVYPCPAPWPGNTIAARIEAGERYHGSDR